MKNRIIFKFFVILLINITPIAYSIPILRIGWPQYMEGTWGFGIKNQLAVYNHYEYEWVIAASTNGQVSLFDTNGNNLPGWPVNFSVEDLTTTGIIIQGPRLGDMNGDGDPELAFRSRVDMVPVYRNEVYSFVGERIESLCVNDTVAYENGLLRSSPVFVDIDGDGCDELVRIYGNAIHADQYIGTEYPGFPISIGDYCNLYNLGVVVGAGDGWNHDYNIVIWSTQNHVHAQRIGETEELTGWPIEVNNPRAFSGPSLMATEEGWIYIIHCQNVLYAWDQDGNALEGFPVENLGSSTAFNPITNYVMIADINGDAQPEILYRDYWETLNVITLDGDRCQGFPRTLYGQSVSDPLAIMHEANSDSAYIHFGTRINRYYLVYTAFHYNNLVQDYEIRIANAYPDERLSERTYTALIPPEDDTLRVVSYNSFPTYGIRVYQIPMEGDGTHIEWQMPGNNAGGNRLYCPRHYLGVAEPEQENIPESYQVNPVYPNPWNNNLQLDLGNLLQGEVIISVFNILGEMVHQTEYGSNRTATMWSWNGIDLQGQAVSSGIYIINISTLSGEFRQKSVLLK